MSHHSPAGYMDGVPVKISERYKRPPKLSLPQKIVQCLADCRRAAVDGPPPPSPLPLPDSDAEHLRLVAARKSARHQERFARRQRVHQRQVERQRVNDERQKQKLTAVSYPSTDELSSGDDGDADGERPDVDANDVGDDNNDNDDDEGRTTDNPSTASGSTPDTASGLTTAETTPQSHREPPSQPPAPAQRFDTILMPTIMPAATAADSPSNNSWSFAGKMSLANGGAGSGGGNPINWSDFENDTSSPFDNIELKTINDLDILAQVLNLNAAAAAAASVSATDAPKSAAPMPTHCDNEHSRRNAANGRTDAPMAGGDSTAPAPPVVVSQTINCNPVAAQPPPVAVGSPQHYSQYYAYAYAPSYASYTPADLALVSAYAQQSQQLPLPQQQQQQQKQQQQQQPMGYLANSNPAAMGATADGHYAGDYAAVAQPGLHKATGAGPDILGCAPGPVRYF